MLIAQLTDLHVRPAGRAAYRVVETNALVERAFAAVAALRERPDLVVMTGDLTDCGLAEEYEQLAELIARYLDMPVYVVPGNHDRRENFREGLGHLPGVRDDAGFVQYVVDSDAMPMRLVMLDSVVPGKGYGDLCDARFDFLERALTDAKGKPTSIFLHHSPMASGILHMDEIGLQSHRRLADVIRRHSHVEAVFCGHSHRCIAGTFAGKRLQIAPSVAHQVRFSLAEEESLAQFVMEPPSYLLHKWIPGHGLVSHQLFVENYAGPFPFVLDKDYPGQH